MTTATVLLLLAVLLISNVFCAPNLTKYTEKRADHLKRGDIILFDTEPAQILSLRLDPDETGCMYLIGKKVAGGENVEVVLEPEDIVALYQ